jgi:hypothetical protein
MDSRWCLHAYKIYATEQRVFTCNSFAKCGPGGNVTECVFFWKYPASAVHVKEQYTVFTSMQDDPSSEMHLPEENVFG